MRAIVRRSGGLRVIQVLTVLLVGLVVVACGGSASQMLSTVGSSVGGAQAQPAASAAPAEEAPAVDGSGQVPDRTGSGEAPLSAPRDDLKIVYTGSLQLVVDDLATALAKAKTAVLATGGYIGASQESNDGDNSVATITYRIPATRWEDAIGDLRGLATKVVAEQTDATEVGGQLVDLDARIRNLRASEASLQQIAKGAGKISDLLEVEAQLTAVRGQIEQLEGQRAQLQDQVAYGTLVTTFGLEVVQVQAAGAGLGPEAGRRRRVRDADRRRSVDRERPDLVHDRVAAGHRRARARRARRAAGSSVESCRRAVAAGSGPVRAGARAPAGS